MSQANEKTVPKLARTNSIYPTLDHSKSFSSIVKGYITTKEEEEEEEKFETPLSQTQQPFNATEKLVKSREHREHQFNYEFNKEGMNAELESRVANWYSAREKAAQQCKLEIPKLVLYNISFHPELETPPHILAKQVWNHFKTYGFNISPTNDTITCVDTPKETSIQNWTCTLDQFRIANLSINQKYKLTLQAILTHFVSEDNMRDHRVV